MNVLVNINHIPQFLSYWQMQHGIFYTRGVHINNLSNKIGKGLNGSWFYLKDIFPWRTFFQTFVLLVFKRGFFSLCVKLVPVFSHKNVYFHNFIDNYESYSNICWCLCELSVLSLGKLFTLYLRWKGVRTIPDVYPLIFALANLI